MFPKKNGAINYNEDDGNNETIIATVTNKSFNDNEKALPD